MRAEWQVVTTHHGNILWNNINASLAFDGLSDDRTLAVAPLFHIGGLHVTPIPSLWKGATVIVEQMFEPGLVLELIEKHRITTMFGVPAMFMFMAQHPDFPWNPATCLVQCAEAAHGHEVVVYQHGGDVVNTRQQPASGLEASFRGPIRGFFQGRVDVHFCAFKRRAVPMQAAGDDVTFERPGDNANSPMTQPHCWGW